MKITKFHNIALRCIVFFYFVIREYQFCVLLSHLRSILTLHQKILFHLSLDSFRIIPYIYNFRLFSSFDYYCYLALHPLSSFLMSELFTLLLSSLQRITVIFSPPHLVFPHALPPPRAPHHFLFSSFLPLLLPITSLLLLSVLFSAECSSSIKILLSLN